MSSVCNQGGATYELTDVPGWWGLGGHANKGWGSARRFKGLGRVGVRGPGRAGSVFTVSRRGGTEKRCRRSRVACTGEAAWPVPSSSTPALPPDRVGCAVAASSAAAALT